MAFSITRAINTFSKKAVQLLRKDLKIVPSLAQKCCIFTSTQARPLSNLLNFAKHSGALLEWQHCKYANLHTEADSRFAELLVNEINEEKRNCEDLPKMSDGWKVSFQGAEGSLTKTHEGDHIKVSFSLNGTLPPIDEQRDDDVDVDNKEMISHPEFNVKVTKSGSPKTVEFDCYFPEDVREGMTDDSMSLFSIRNVVIYEGEISESTYIMETENLFQDVYSYFLTFLADRSVDQQFAEELIELASAAEQQEYIRTLEDLKKFISSK